MIHRTTLFLLLAYCFLIGCSSQADPKQHWTRNTFPSAGHVAHDFPEGCGSDRTEYVTAFGVSPHQYEQGWWIMMSTDLGPLLSSTNGSVDRYAAFEQTEFPFYAPKAINFNPHDKFTAYVIKTDINADAAADNGRSGIYRTQDKAKTWEQIFREPAGEKRLENSGRQTGQCEITADPHPDRKGHLYYAHGARGLFRTKIAHEDDNEKVIDSWELKDFILSLSTDAGKTWTALPVVPKEVSFFRRGKMELAARTVNGFPREYRPVAFDPSVNPRTDGKTRLLLAGRSGVYEFAADKDASAGEWTLLASDDFEPLPDSGALTKDDVGKPEPRSSVKITSNEAVGPRPELEQVIFDANRPNVVYAVAGYRPKDGGRDPNNGLPGLTRHPAWPVYRSLDGGKTWTQLGGENSGLPKFIKPQVINVGPQGTFFIQDFGGEFSLPAPK